MLKEKLQLVPLTDIKVDDAFWNCVFQNMLLIQLLS